MPLCVATIPTSTPFVRNLDGGENFPALYPALVVDPSCSSGYKLYTQAEMLALQPPVDPERIADMATLFYAFVLVLVTVWGIKQLLNLFSGDTSRD